jgi:peptidoglycan/LPS O-acetylase OafA/YrhL
VNAVRTQRIAVIDALRGVAIGLVVWYHVWQITWQPAAIPFTGISLQQFAETGFLGVTLFFFISGFVLALPYVEARLANRPAQSLRHFFERRFFKIVPSYVLSIVVMLAVGYQTYTSFWPAAKDVVFHLLFIHNWFASTDGTINGVMWSLATEVQFYFIFPLVIYLFVRRPVTVTVGLFVIANAWRLWCLVSNHYFYELRLQQLPAHIDFFAAGMIAAYIYATVSARGALVAKLRWPAFALMLAGIIGFVVLANGFYAVRSDHEWPRLFEVEWRSLAAIDFTVVGLGMLFTFRTAQRAIANRFLLFFALISYNLYLWHQQVARELLKYHIPPFATADPHNDPRWQVTFSILAIIAGTLVAWLITIIFEIPILRLGSRRRTDPVVGLAISPSPEPAVLETATEH